MRMEDGSGQEDLELVDGMAAGPLDEGFAGGVVRLVGCEDFRDERR